MRTGGLPLKQLGISSSPAGGAAYSAVPLSAASATAHPRIERIKHLRWQDSTNPSYAARRGEPAHENPGFAVNSRSCADGVVTVGRAQRGA